LRGNLSDGYNDMCSGAGSASNLDSSHMMNGFFFPNSQAGGTDILEKSHRYHPLGTLHTLTRTFGKPSVSPVAA
jgi:hypothetical protein